MRNVAMRRKKTRKPSPEEMSLAEQETARYLKDVEGRFRTLLSPIEAYVMGIQSTLVWEVPSFSGCVFIAVNVVFWLATRMRFYHLLGLTGLAVVFLDIWIHKIWPEIRVSPLPNEDQEEWTLVHPKLLSVPELSRHLARVWITTSGALHWLFILRCTSHAKFFVVMMLILIVIGVVGLYISGITLLYITVMGVFLLPPLVYYNLLTEVYSTAMPTILRLEKIFSVKRTRSKKKGDRPAIEAHEGQAFISAFTEELDQLIDGKKKSGEGHDGGGIDEGSDSDEGLEEFVPEEETITKTLSKATNNESEEDSSGHTPGLLTPDGLSQGPSRDISDTDSVGDDTANFARGLKAIPDFDDTRLDDSLTEDRDTVLTGDDEVPDLDVSTEDADQVALDEALPDVESEQQQGPAPAETVSSEAMPFVAGHFKDSSESDADLEGEMAEGLAFPDIQDELETMAKEEETSSAAMATEMVSKTVSTLMSSTMSGLSRLSETASRLGETVRSAAKSATTANTDERDTDSSDVLLSREGVSSLDETAAGSADGVQPSRTLRKTITESTDSDILAEFEFLDQEELDILGDDEAGKDIDLPKPATDDQLQQSAPQQ